MRSIRPTSSRSAAISECRVIAPVLGEALRRSAGLSLRDIARDLRVSSQTVFKWEKGINRPSGDHALAYLEILRGLESLHPEEGE